jgi:hypothetical protein
MASDTVRPKLCDKYRRRAALDTQIIFRDAFTLGALSDYPRAAERQFFGVTVVVAAGRSTQASGAKRAELTELGNVSEA